MCIIDNLMKKTHHHIVNTGSAKKQSYHFLLWKSYNFKMQDYNYNFKLQDYNYNFKLQHYNTIILIIMATEAVYLLE